MRVVRRKVVSVGEAMVEMAPVGDGLYRRGFAGDTFNTAWHMAQLLSDEATVGYVTRVGTDGLSDRFVAEVARDGLDPSGIGRDPVRTMGLYLIELDGVERRFSYWRSASAARGLADDPAELGSALLDAGLIHFSGITLAILPDKARTAFLDLLGRARAAGAIVSFDPNIRPRLWSSPEEIRFTIGRALAVSDIALPSFDDERMVWNDESPSRTVDRHLAAGVSEVVVKDGAGEVLLHADGATRSCATPPVVDIVDTTGAGDAFNAGYLSARFLGLDGPASVRAGQAVAAEVIRAYGARAPRERLPVLVRPVA